MIWEVEEVGGGLDESGLSAPYSAGGDIGGEEDGFIGCVTGVPVTEDAESMMKCEGGVSQSIWQNQLCWI